MRKSASLIVVLSVTAFLVGADETPELTAEEKRHAAPEYRVPAPLRAKKPSAADATIMRVEPQFHIPAHRELAAGAWRWECGVLLGAAQWRQDIVQVLNADAHFDNCRFTESATYVREQMKNARSEIAAGRDPFALTAMGRALHGIQDFYAHTNYIELMQQEHESVGTIPIVPVWTDDGVRQLQSLVAKGLVSGYVWWEPANACGPKALTHAGLSKDSSDTASGRKMNPRWQANHHAVALALAKKASDEFLRSMFAEPGFEKLRQGCSNDFEYPVITDNRRNW